jgi:hypothetical protein
MYENQFIQFTQAIDPLDNCMPLPVVFGGDGIAFFVPTDNKDAEFSVVDAEGNPFTHNGNTLHNKFRSLAGNYAAGMFYDGIALFRSKLFPANTARDYVAPDECFRIKIHSEETLANVSAFTYAVDASSIAQGESIVRTIDIEGLTDKTFAKGTYTLKIPKIYVRYWSSNGVPYQQWANIQISAGSQIIFNHSAYFYPAEIECTFTANSSFRLSVRVQFGYYTGGRTSGDAFTFDFGESSATLKDAIGVDWYSNLLRRYENPKGELALLSYTCDTETFDLPFTSSRPIRQWLPIWLNKPAFNQKDEIYEKLSGERVVLFATINKELQAQTDYIPEWWHERIVLALSCDKVFVNGTRLTKSDNYDIDWDNHTEADCGVWLAKAKWKMVANVTSRNANN